MTKMVLTVILYVYGRDRCLYENFHYMIFIIK